jgi:hypothetical protein
MNTRQQDVDQSVWWVLTLPVRKGVIDRAPYRAKAASTFG